MPSSKMLRVIGLISGTSVDGIDAALVEIAGEQTDLTFQLVAASTYPYSPPLKAKILEVCSGAALSMAQLATLDDAIAEEFAKAALTIQTKYGRADLIASHGQTVYHRPPLQKSQDAVSALDTQLGYSLQLGRGAVIAHLTGIPTVSNFRAADIAALGQGAPLVSCVDAYLLSHPTKSRCVQNLGGIGNVTYLPAKGTKEERMDGIHRLPGPPASFNQILGWDTGPGNALLDLAAYQLSGGTLTYDQDGAYAAQGTPCQTLVEQWLQDDFFQQKPPKSTGRELFGPDYLQRCLTEAQGYHLGAADILATLTELTAASIYHSYRTFLPQLPDQVLLCGGGSHNLYLRSRLQLYLDPIPVLTTSEVGMNADFKEAIAFAILAYWRWHGIPGNLPQVTGAKAAVLLGEIHTP